MKRTTYILSAMMLAGLLIMGGLLFYIASYTTEWEEPLMEVRGEQQVLVLPPCKVVKLTQPPVIWKQKREGVMETERFTSFRNVPLSVSPTDSLQGSLSLAGDMTSFVSITAVGDTACITFDFPTEKLESRFQNVSWLLIKSERMGLKIPASVQTVVVNMEDMETDFRDFRCDTLSFRALNTAKVENCRIISLSAQAQTLRFHSGEVENLYLNLDGISDWNVKVDSFHIDTEHLTGSRGHSNVLQKGECRQVLWTPQNEAASLNVTIRQAARIKVGEEAH